MPQGRHFRAAAGVAKMITAEYVGKGAVVIDVGINVDNNGNYAVMWIQTVFLRLHPWQHRFRAG